MTRNEWRTVYRDARKVHSFWEAFYGVLPEPPSLFLQCDRRASLAACGASSDVLFWAQIHSVDSFRMLHLRQPVRLPA